MKPEVKRKLREHTVKYLYQCECEKINFFSSIHLDNFIEHFAIRSDLVESLKKDLQDVFENRTQIDKWLKQSSEKWSLERMPLLDRNILRLAIWELMSKKAPRKVILNEAIELAKEFGADHSSRFINGVLDKAAHLLSVEGNCDEPSEGNID